LSVDQEGNLYVAEVQNGRIQKFRPKANADPAKVVGQEVRLPRASSN
jgi:sugar lactone lactonase YvrE